MAQFRSSLGRGRAALLATLALAAAPRASAQSETAPTPAAPPAVVWNDNPFGLHVMDEELALLRGDFRLAGFEASAPLLAMGCGWARINFMWWRSEDEAKGPLSMPGSAEVEKLHRAGIKIFATIIPSYDWTDRSKNTELYPKSDEDVAAFVGFLRAFHRNYAGKIQAYQFDNEVEIRGIGPADYAQTFALFHRTIRELDADVMILPSGIACIVQRFMKSYWPAILQTGIVPDGIDLHFHPSAGHGIALPQRMQELGNAIRNPRVRLFTTENTTWSGDMDGVYQSEEQQAISFVTRLSMGAGVGAVTLGGPLLDRRTWKGEEFGKYSLNGLCYNPVKNYAGVHSGKDERRDGPKLAYWAVRRLCERTRAAQSADFRFVTKLVAQDRPTVMHVDAPAGPFYLAWLNTAGSRPGKTAKAVSIELALHPDARSIRVERAVPSRTALDLHPAGPPERIFEAWELPVREGRVEIVLDETPVYLVPIPHEGAAAAPLERAKSTPEIAGG